VASPASFISPILTLPGGKSGHVDPPVDQPSGEKSVNLLNQKHPEYEARFEAWLDLSLLYEGGAALKARSERLLKKRPREDEEVYAARMDRFTYQNILGTGLGWYGAAMFDKAPEIFFNGKSGDEEYTKFLSDCDGIGTTYIDFFKRVFQVLLTYGAGWILVDTRALEDGEEPPETLEDERSRGLLEPHLACFSPLNVINWQVDKMGKLRWAVLKTEVQEQQFLAKPEVVSTWYHFTRERFDVYEDRKPVAESVRVSIDDDGRMAKWINGGKHALSRVDRLPLRRLTLSEGLWLANRSYLLLIDHLNQDNTLAWALFMSNLAMPIIIGDVDTSNLTYAETGHLQFPAGTKYMWSEPAGTSFLHSFLHSSKRVESLREECFRSMNLQAQGRSMRATPAMQSGFSKLLEMAPAKQILSGMGDDLRKHMQAVLCDVIDVKNQPEVEPDVRGFNFEEDMSTDEVFAVSSLLKMQIPSETFEKYIYKKMAKAWMPDANRDVIVKVYDEIEAGPTMEEREQEEFKKKVKMASAEMRDQLANRNKGFNQPPGQGGVGPSPGGDNQQ
jgi:hypothetical protein